MLFHGDCLDFMQNLGDNSIDAIVTDPPYGLKFMGKNGITTCQALTSGKNACAY